jgi:site-specific recombinase XerD
VEKIIGVMCAAGDDPDGLRLRGVIVVLWRAGLRISEAVALVETDLDQPRGAILVRQGKDGKRREVGMDRWAWEQLAPWLAYRATLPVGALFCVLRGQHAAGHAQLPESARNCETQRGQRERDAGSRPTNSGTHAVEISREGIPLLVIQRQLGHANLGITSAYLRGIDNTEVIGAVHERPTPMIPATARLKPR